MVGGSEWPRPHPSPRVAMKAGRGRSDAGVVENAVMWERGGVALLLQGFIPVKVN